MRPSTNHGLRAVTYAAIAAAHAGDHLLVILHAALAVLAAQTWRCQTVPKEVKSPQ